MRRASIRLPSRCVVVAAVLAGAGLVAFCAADVEAAGAPAASKAPTATPAPPQPGTTTASFEDWVLGCQRVGPADKQIRVCEVGQVIRAEGQQNAVARVAIGRLKPSDPLHFTALVPPNVSFPSTVRVGLSDTDPAALELPWRRCVTGFCQADADLKDEVLKTWRSAADPGRITFQDATGRTIAVPLSLKGLAPALDALAKEGP